MARRFGSAMISNTDPTFLIYSAEHMLVKEYYAQGCAARGGGCRGESLGTDGSWTGAVPKAVAAGGEPKEGSR